MDAHLFDKEDEEYYGELETKAMFISEAPEKIYLQVADDLGDEAGEITWCTDSQYKFDVEYIRKDLHDAEIKRLQHELDALSSDMSLAKQSLSYGWDKDFDNEFDPNSEW